MANGKKSKVWFEYRANLHTEGKQAGQYGLKVSSVVEGARISQRENLFGGNMFTRTFRARSKG